MDEPFAVEFVHRVRSVADALDPDDGTLAALLERDAHSRPRAFAVLDSGLLDANLNLPDRLDAYARAHSLDLVGTHTMPGGEAAKNDERHWRTCLERIHDARLCRRSYLLAIGGGAVLDAAGFAASLAHRGVRCVRIPTTTLSQCDSGVGVKNGVNAFGLKNYIGVFDPPWGVVCDALLLRTLPDRHWRSGFSECVKVGLVKDAALFERIERDARSIAARDEVAALPIVRRSGELHVTHITRTGDAFERTLARPLDFGHWAAHKLEQLTAYEITHGEAVAIGIALDTEYARLTGLLTADHADRVIACLRALGFDLAHPALANPDLSDGLDEFREHLGGRLCITLLRAPGEPVDVYSIDAAIVREAAARFAP